MRGERISEAAAACPWDPARLELATSSPARAWAILELLLQLGEETLAAMRATEAAEPWRRAAHNLRGAALNLGMERLAGLCRDEAALTADAAQRDELREAIAAELRRIATYKHSLEH